MSRPVESNRCTDGISQHTFEIQSVTREGNDELVAFWVCVDCNSGFYERRSMDDESAYISSAEELD